VAQGARLDRLPLAPLAVICEPSLDGAARD
jgi:hypothetical protein